MNVTATSGKDDIEPFELFAIRYGHHAGRSQHENFIGGDPHESGSPLDYFVWVVRRAAQVYVIDTGFGPEAAAARGRQLLRMPADGIRLLGIDPDRVTDVILTHLHYDHAGTLGSFPKARFHLQDSESAYATGRCMCHGFFRQAFNVEDVVSLVRHLYAGRVVFHDGMGTLVPGLSLHHVGGHTAGLQVVRVRTRRGWVVLASDATHLYANMERGAPFPIVHSVAGMFEGYRVVRELADSADHVIPGHDPLVMQRYPPPSPELDGIVARLDIPPNYRRG
jgi:glyoxylase-like metal-dependent hydrolase (beta-lactamase superfamily II)